MKIALSFVSAAFAIGLATLVAAEFAGVQFARSIDALGLFTGFVASLTALTLTSDYHRVAPTPSIGNSVCQNRRQKAVHPLAA